MTVMAGADLRYISSLCVIGVTGVTLFAIFTDYTKERITVWRDPEAYKLTGGWQTLQGLMAIGSGGIFGVGLGNSKQKQLYISDEELKTLDGLLNLIVNDNNYDSDPNNPWADLGYNPNKFQFAPLPVTRLANAENKSEFYLNLLVYMNLNANYLNNKEVINNFVEEKISGNGSLSTTGEDEEGNIVYGDKDRLENIIYGITGDSLEDVFTVITLVDLMMENITNKPNEIMGNIAESISRIIKKIADWFQMWIDIFTGKLEFGAGAFD